MVEKGRKNWRKINCKLRKSTLKTREKIGKEIRGITKKKEKLRKMIKIRREGKKYLYQRESEGMSRKKLWKEKRRNEEKGKKLRNEGKWKNAKKKNNSKEKIKKEKEKK